MVSLGKTFVAGVIWGTIEKFASLFIGFVITVLLARKLTPADYGLVNMIHIFTVFGMVLIYRLSKNKNSLYILRIMSELL